MKKINFLIKRPHKHLEKKIKQKIGRRRCQLIEGRKKSEIKTMYYYTSIKKEYVNNSGGP